MTKSSDAEHKLRLYEAIGRVALALGSAGRLQILEFVAGHLPGAVNIPVHELEKRLKELPRRKEVIAYCRGPYCLMSYDAVSLLRRKGRKARRLEAGLPEWRAAGLPIERSNRESK